MFFALISIDMNALTGNVSSSGGNPVTLDLHFVKKKGVVL
jgi:hypothetical protein